MALFEPGPHDSPAEILFDPRGLLNPGELGPIARQIFGLKNAAPQDPALARISAHLKAETTRAFGLPVPPGLADAGLMMSTALVARAHLPGRQLALAYFPVLISDACAGSAMILPSRWWPEALAEQWDIDDAAEPDVPTEPAELTYSKAAVDPPSSTAAKNLVLQVVESPVPASDAAGWAHLDRLLAAEEARLQALKPGLLRKLFGKAETGPSVPRAVFTRYLRQMAHEYPGCCEPPPDYCGKVLSLMVAADSVNYVVETARRKFGLTVFDSNHFNLVYRPAPR